jgi:hypothetical protein
MAIGRLPKLGAKVMPTFQSADPNVPAVDGEHSTSGTALAGNSVKGMGVHGVNDAPRGSTLKPNFGCGVWGESSNGYGVFGASNTADGVKGQSVGASGVLGLSTDADGVAGAGKTGVHGSGQFAGVRGTLADQPAGGVFFQLEVYSALGVLGTRDSIFNELAGVFGESAQCGVFGNSNGRGGTGVHGRGGEADSYGVRGEIGNGVAAVQGQCFGAGLAGKFIGNVEIDGAVTVSSELSVTGDVFLRNRDLAERFIVEPGVTPVPGTVMVAGDRGVISPCDAPYDRRVVGVVSGAGDVRAAITLGEELRGGANAPIAMVGTTLCAVDADYGAVAVGDFLTTSGTLGHAMKATDAALSFGAVIGKALASLPSGRGLVPILVALL